MKTLEKNQVNQLLQIIQNKPAQRIVHFSDNSLDISERISQLCISYDNEYHLRCCDTQSYEILSSQYQDYAHIQVFNFNLKRPRYVMQGIEYDYLISSLDFNNEDKEAFLQKCYPIIRTGGNIVLFTPKGDYASRDTWRAILEEQYYVSVNIIDNIFTDYDVIVAKRMHGWGN